jgi:hypothetical protein
MASVDSYIFIIDEELTSTISIVESELFPVPVNELVLDTARTLVLFTIAACMDIGADTALINSVVQVVPETLYTAIALKASFDEPV